MKRPSDGDMQTAILWLDSNEGDDGESDSCQRVAQWLAQIVDEAINRHIARKAGVPVKALRDRLAKAVQS
jgi:hypothetical protein